MNLIEEFDDKCTFSDLPEPIQLYIFSFLDCVTLLKAAQVCQTWNRLCTDNLLWKDKLESDMMKWNVIGHTFNPNSLRLISEPDYKQIYMACSPLMRKNKITLLGKISKAFQYVINRKVPKLAMFGPGLESGGTRLVINLLQDYTNTFKFISLFPGRFEGIGSGITLNLSSHSLEFNLITLYTATQNEREHRSAEKRALQSRLFVQENSGQNQSKLQRAIKDLCRTLDGLIYVVHASCSQDELVLGLPELLALSNEVLIPSHVPLLVLSCATDQDTSSRSSVELAKELQLLKLNRPWQVHNCRVDGMLGIEDAFKWIIETSRSY